VKKAKREHWNQFLEKENTKSIFKALRYTKAAQIEKIPSIRNYITSDLEESFEGKAVVFRATLFLTPPVASALNYSNYTLNSYNWPELSKIELKTACSAKIKGKTFGPDLIIQSII